jgi:hypothetical protein
MLIQSQPSFACSIAYCLRRALRATIDAMAFCFTLPGASNTHDAYIFNSPKYKCMHIQSDKKPKNMQICANMDEGCSSTNKTDLRDIAVLLLKVA